MSGAGWFLAGVAMCAAVFMLRSPGEHGAGSSGLRLSDIGEADRAIAPEDFILLPCDGVRDEVACLILAAGGKRVLIGAPAGIGAARVQGETALPDAILLFSLRAGQLEGLDELRNHAWEAGIRKPLTVAGGAGVGQFVDSLNAAFTVSDALAYAEGRRQGGFGLTVLAAKTVKPGDTAFDTGDLRIRAIRGGASRLAFLVSYNDKTLLLAGCGARDGDIAAWPQADAYVGCRVDAYPATHYGSWPVRSRIDFE